MILHYKKYGDSANPVICIVHGLFGTLDNWHNVARILSDQFYVVSMDMRNHGNSAHSNDMNYDLMANDIAETLRNINLAEANFIGHSMGGKVVMRFAELHPAMVHKMIVVDIAPKKYPAGHTDIFKAMFALDLTLYTNRNEIDSALSLSIADTSTRLFLLKNIDRKKEGGFEWKMHLDAIYAHYTEIIDRVAPSWPISNEVLFVKGDRSAYISEDDEQDIHQLFLNAEVSTISNAGHWVHADNPKEFIEVAEAFLT